MAWCDGHGGAATWHLFPEQKGSPSRWACSGDLGRFGCNNPIRARLEEDLEHWGPHVSERLGNEVCRWVDLGNGPAMQRHKEGRRAPLAADRWVPPVSTQFLPGWGGTWASWAALWAQYRPLPKPFIFSILISFFQISVFQFKFKFYSQFIFQHYMHHI
jgi:hypothetical protein